MDTRNLYTFSGNNILSGDNIRDFFIQFVYVFFNLIFVLSLKQTWKYKQVF